MNVDLSHYREPKPRRLKRVCWAIVNATLFRCLAGRPCKRLRNIILRLFGARIPLGSLVYPSCKIWAPWNLAVGEHSCIGPNTELYNKAPVTIGDNAVVSQGAFLCTASHDISSPNMHLISAPIVIGNSAWVAADAFVGKGVSVGEGAVVAARTVVVRDVEPWTVVGGNPAKFLKKRVLND